MRTGQGQRQVFKSNHCVVYTCQPEGSAPLFEAQPLINQHAYAFGAEKICDQSSIGPVIVIAQNGINAVSGAQASYHFGAARGIAAIMGDVVARQGHNIGIQPVCHLDRALYLLRSSEGAVVKIRQMHNPHSIK